MSIRRFLYLRPDEMQTLYATVTGDVESAFYDVGWLADGLPSKPMRSGTGDPSWDFSNPPKDVNCLALLDSNVDEDAVIAITGDIVDNTLIQPPYRDQYPVNPFTLLEETVVGVEDLTVTITGNSCGVIATQFVAGLARELDFEQGGARGFLDFNKPPDPQIGNIAVYDEQTIARRLSGTVKTDEAGYEALLDWFYATREGARFSIIIPHSDKNDAWAVKFERKPEATYKGGLVTVTLAFVEYPRHVWPRPGLTT